MTEYIEREKLNDTLDELCVNDSLYNALQSIPVADAAPVVHAHWEKDKEGYSLCSECKRYAVPTQFSQHLGNFCPYCGAKMDGKRGDKNA